MNVYATWSYTYRDNQGSRATISDFCQNSFPSFSTITYRVSRIIVFYLYLPTVNRITPRVPWTVKVCVFLHFFVSNGVDDTNWKGQKASGGSEKGGKTITTASYMMENKVVGERGKKSVYLRARSSL